MGLEQNFRMAFKSLMSSKVRAILTMLGIIIGVAAVIVITGLGSGTVHTVKQRLHKPADSKGKGLLVQPLFF